MSGEEASLTEVQDGGLYIAIFAGVDEEVPLDQLSSSFYAHNDGDKGGILYTITVPDGRALVKPDRTRAITRTVSIVGLFQIATMEPRALAPEGALDRAIHAPHPYFLETSRDWTSWVCYELRKCRSESGLCLLRPFSNDLQDLDNELIIWGKAHVEAAIAGLHPRPTTRCASCQL